jgi:hypothetical protein
MANIAEIKSQLGVSQLNLTTAIDASNAPTEWMRHWDNTNRVAISIHKDTVRAIQADTTCNLGIQTETRKTEKGDYTSHRIVKYTPAEITL